MIPDDEGIVIGWIIPDSPLPKGAQNLRISRVNLMAWRKEQKKGPLLGALRRRSLALGELEALTSLLAAVLLPFLGSGIAGKQILTAELPAILGIDL